MDKSLLVKLIETVEQHRAERQQGRQAEGVRTPGRWGRLARWFLPNGGTLLLIAALILTQRVWASPALVPAAPGPSATTVNYQGRLADPSGNPKNGVFGMTFALYDALSGGNLKWGPESHTAVSVSDGLFSVGLGSQTSGGIPTSVWNGDRYLEITVGGETLTPRELIRSVPIAGMALTVPDGAITQAKAPFAVQHYVVTTPEQYPKVSTGSYVVSLSGGSPVEYTDVNVSAIGFDSIPVGIAQITGSGGPDWQTFARFQYDGSTATTARIYFFRSDGQPLQSGLVRFDLILWSN